MSYLFCIIFEIELGFLQFLGEYFLNITYFLFVSCFDVCDSIVLSHELVAHDTNGSNIITCTQCFG